MVKLNGEALSAVIGTEQVSALTIVELEPSQVAVYAEYTELDC